MMSFVVYRYQCVAGRMQYGTAATQGDGSYVSFGKNSVSFVKWLSIPCSALYVTRKLYYQRYVFSSCTVIKILWFSNGKEPHL